MRQPFGQHFLADQNIARRIVDAAGISAGDTVVEIGPGKGVLTDLIAPAACHLYAVEIDRTLAEPLRRRFKNNPHLEIITADYLRLDHAVSETAIPVYLSNLPYNVSTAIIEKILLEGRWKRAVFMLQKEVADRITAMPGTSSYGAYSVFCQYFARTEPLFRVPPSCFVPAPEVDSAVIRMTPTHAPVPSSTFVPLVRACFQHKRKTIANSLERSTNIAKDDILRCLQSAGISGTMRAQQLPLECFITLTRLLEICTIVTGSTLIKK
ncbi:MAG: 16S rRNA (adenine(1518)-N(6)/adenine(1519)-N(6))-dimethyltransferase RsmA [Endomicrobiales bacterium]|jgi:16S rRNA (adenine1518-N6/adenine1519-N6)-dimethyltransferase